MPPDGATAHDVLKLIEALAGTSTFCTLVYAYIKFVEILRCLNMCEAVLRRLAWRR